MTKKKNLDPFTSIVIPTYNNSDLTIQAVDSIIKLDDRTIYAEIIVVDNGSTKEELQKLKDNQTKFRLINLTQNHGYGQAVNAAVSVRTECADVVVLNNDTLMTKGWLRNLQEVAYSEKKYGIVGPIMLYGNGTVQSSGGFLMSTGWGNHTHDVPKETVEVEYCPGACLYVKNELIIKLGNKIFNETFFPAYSEDVWLGYEARKLGYLSVITPKSFIYHLEGMTSKNNAMTGQEKHQLEIAKCDNRDKLFKKLEDIDYTDKKKKHKVAFIGASQGGWSYVTVLRNLTKALDNTKTVDVAIFNPSYHEYQAEPDWHLSKMLSKPKDFTNRITVRYGEGSTMFLSSGKAKIGYTTHESTSVIPSDWVYQLNQLDQVWTTTEYVKKVFITSGVKKPIFVIPHGIDFNQYNPEIKPAKLSNVKGFVFYVNNIYGPRKNIDQILYAYAQEFTCDDNVTLLLKCNFNDMLKPVKAIDYFSRFQRRDGKNPKIEVIEKWVSPDILAKLYRRADCFIGIGNEGFGMTNQEAMACGTPCIAPSWGGLTEFCTFDNSLILQDSRNIPARQDFLYKQYANTEWKVPNPAELQQAMRYAYTHQDEMKILGTKAYETVSKMTWQSSALKCELALENL